MLWAKRVANRVTSFFPSSCLQIPKTNERRTNPKTFSTSLAHLQQLATVAAVNTKHPVPSTESPLPVHPRLKPASYRKEVAFQTYLKHPIAKLGSCPVTVRSGFWQHKHPRVSPCRPFPVQHAATYDLQWRISKVVGRKRLAQNSRIWL